MDDGTSSNGTSNREGTNNDHHPAEPGPVEAVLRAYLAAGDRGDDATLRDLLTPDVVVHAPGGTVTEGVEAAIATWAAARAGIGELEHRVLHVVELGDHAAARGWAGGIHRGTFLGVAPTGATLSVDQALFVRLAGGRIAELWEVVDTGSGMRQLGLLPEEQVLGPGE